LSKVEYTPRAESGLIFTFYMGKNTPERKDYIMDRLVVPVKSRDLWCPSDRQSQSGRKMSPSLDGTVCSFPLRPVARLRCGASKRTVTSGFPDGL